MKIIADQNLIESFKQIFVGHEQENFTVIQLDRLDEHGKRENMAGLDDVITVCQESMPPAPAAAIIMLGLRDYEDYTSDPRWSEIANHCYAQTFLQLPKSKAEMLGALNHVLGLQRQCQRVRNTGDMQHIDPHNP